MLTDPPRIEAKKRLWLDEPNALQVLHRSEADQGIKSIARDLIDDGFTIIRNAIPASLCDQVVNDYHEYSRQKKDYVQSNLDIHGKEKRLVSFHHWSEAELKIGTAPRIMEVLDYLFGEEACVYTSLTFKYGTQQPIHRDTPHFATWPDSYFFGVWTALEDIHADAGPLQYYPGGHHFKIDQYRILEEVKNKFPNLPLNEQLTAALIQYCDEVSDRSPQESRPLQLASMRKGDTAIWHPQLPHGGFPAANPSLSRWSVVFHCAPVDVQVHQHEQFFTHRSETPPPPRYGFKEAYGRKIALAGDTGFM